MRRKLLIIIGAVLAAAVISAGSIVTYEHVRGRDRDVSEPGTTEGGRSGAVLPLVRALDIAAGHVPGEVLKVELEDEDGMLAYEIKVLADNGRVREIKLNAHSGELIEIEDD